jgi:putative MATE family efflux protein
LQKEIRKEVFRLAIPAALSSLLQRTVSIFDIFLVGGLGASSIAAVGIGQLSIFVAMTIFLGLSAGTTVVIAHLVGAEKGQEAGKTAYQSILVVSGVAVLISLIGIAFSSELPLFMGADAEVTLIADTYLKIIFYAFIFTTLVNILTGIMHGHGDTKTPLKAIIFVNILHFVIAYPLIYGKFGCPQIGVPGAAIAIGVSEAVGAIWLFWAAIKRGYIKKGPIDTILTRRVLRVGMPVALDRVMQQLGQMAFAMIVMGYGTAAYAAHQIGLSIEAFSFMPGLGLSIAAATMVGHSLGAEKADGAKISTIEATRLAVIIMTTMGLCFFFLPYLFMRAFTTDPQVIEHGTMFLKIVAILQIPLAISMVLAGTLRGGGDSRYSMLTTIAGMWLFRIPAALILIKYFHVGLYTTWSLMIFDWLLRVTMLVYRYRSGEWQKKV